MFSEHQNKLQSVVWALENILSFCDWSATIVMPVVGPHAQVLIELRPPPGTLLFGT